MTAPRNAKPAGSNGGWQPESFGSERHKYTSRQHQSRPFGCHLPDELDRAEWLYCYLKAQPDLKHADNTAALLEVWLEEIAKEWRFRECHNLNVPGPYIFPDGLIQDLRESIDLRQVADDDLSLSNRGRAAMALCPFHDDKEPSLAIYANGFQCFGCEAHGDVFDWFMLFRGIRGFPDAVRYAAGLAGSSLPERQKRKRRNDSPKQRGAFEYRRGQVVAR